MRNQVRIIAGQWRSRRIAFPDAVGLRPTPDRIRETLFNWLAPQIANRTCLDLFAGSGALGFEALSRGAKSCVLIERDKRVVETLRESAEKLGADTAEIFCGEALKWLTQTPMQQFDLVFLDPPFEKGLLAACCEKIAPWLKPGALIYMEAEATLPAWPTQNWHCLHDKQSGDVKYGLWRA